MVQHTWIWTERKPTASAYMHSLTRPTGECRRLYTLNGEIPRVCTRVPLTTFPMAWTAADRAPAFAVGASQYALLFTAGSRAHLYIILQYEGDVEAVLDSMMD